MSIITDVISRSNIESKETKDVCQNIVTKKDQQRLPDDLPTNHLAVGQLVDWTIHGLLISTANNCLKPLLERLSNCDI